MAAFNVFDSMPRSMGFELHSPLQYQKQEPVFLSFSSLSENYSGSMTLSWTGQTLPPPPPMDSNVPEWYPESFDVSEHFSLDSPTLSEEALTVTPPEYSSNSFVSLEPVHGGLDASLAPPASPSVWDLTEPLLSSSPGGGDCFPPPMTPPPGLHSKASFELFFSCSSGFSEYLATPKLNSTPLVNNGQQQQQQLWGEQSLYPSISVAESSPLFPTGLTPSKTPLLCQGIVLPSTPCPPRNKKVAQLGKLGLGHRQVSPSSQRPFQARQLSETFDQIAPPCSESSSHALPLAPSHLLPPPHIVGNIQGWQSSSPTCSSLLDFNVVATTPTTSTTPLKSSQNAEAGPSQFVRPSISPLGLTTPPAPKRKRVRSRAASSQKSLFAFHPVDISSPLGTPNSRGYLDSPLSTTSSSAASRASGSYFPQVPLCSSNNSTVPPTPSDESLAISTPLENVGLVQSNVPFPSPPCLSSPVPLAKTNNAPVSTRPMAPIPKRRISSNKQSQQPQRKSLGETDSTTKITFGSFINYTPKDAVALQSAVAPSGTKRRAYSDSEISTKRSRSSSVQSHDSF